MTILLRFIIGALLAASIAVFTGFDFPLVVVFILVVATVAAIWGDKFFEGFMSIAKYLKQLQ
jgi:hypothetical protein